jgi:hypothetical protein
MSNILHRAVDASRTLGSLQRSGVRDRLSPHRHAPNQEGGFSRKTARTGAVTLIQRFGSALNLKTQE